MLAGRANHGGCGRWTFIPVSVHQDSAVRMANVDKHFLAHCGAGMLANVVGAGMCLPIAGGSSFVMRPHVQASWWQAEQDAGLPGIPRSPAVTRQLGRGLCVRAREGVGLAPTWM